MIDPSGYQQQMSPPLYGQMPPRDALVQALMNGISGPGPSANSGKSAFGGLDPVALAGLMKLLKPSPGQGVPEAAPGAQTADTVGLPPMGGAAIDYAAGAHPQIIY